MNEYQYNSILENCEKLLDEGKNDEVFQTLQELYPLKPVRLYWHIVHAKYIWKSQGILDFDSLSDKSMSSSSYPGIRKLTNLYMDMVQSYQDIPDIQRHKLYLIQQCGSQKKEELEWFQQMEEDFRQAKIDFLAYPDAEETGARLFHFCFSFQNSILLFLLYTYMERKELPIPPGREWFFEFSNNGFLKENLSENSQAPFVLFEDEESGGLDAEIILHILQQLSKQVYYIKHPVLIELDHEVEMKETAAVSINTMERKENLCVIYPALLTCQGEILGDNRDYILDDLLKNELKNQYAVILASGVLMDNLCQQSILKKNLETLYRVPSPIWENQMVFGWAGDYLAYISYLHDMDARKLFTQPAECRYSVIIPARNSAHTLRYTLMSCLNQRYRGDYEIVLSDNSTPGNTEVYQLYKELNDPRIKYYRTPREYNLSRSFEFAFLHAKGEFLLSLGSDDALLPWALEVLEELRKAYPDEEVIQWERGFYAWPGFNGGQQHQFVIPRNYQKGSFSPEYLDQSFYFRSILNNSNQMYILPNLYLNSGCRRDYLKTILAKTGRLFDGICQDIYMGVVNAAINEKIFNIHYPLTIAGMSGGSMGAKANMVYELKEDEIEFLNDMKKAANVGGYCASIYECLMPEVTTDKSSLYNCILRMIARGVIAESDLEHFDFQKWFLDVFYQMDIRDPLFDRKLHYFQYIASLHGSKFLKWFNENIYYPSLTPRVIDEKKLKKIREKKSYTEGKNETGGQTLDASKYQVNNVWEAAQLFEKMTGL